MTRAIRWSDNDRYFGPFTYARDSRYRPFAIMLGSGDNDDYPYCRLRLSAFGRTLIVRLPAIIKPWTQKVLFSCPDMRARVIAQGREPFYFDTHEREYGISISEGAAHIHYGPQTHDSCTSKSKCYFIPWRSWRHVRRSLYDLCGKHFVTLPNVAARLGMDERRNQWAVEEALTKACPTQDFRFADFDGEEITATTRIEEREWKLGEGKFKWLSLFRKPKIRRSLDLHFSSEVGRRKGSWKGGTIGHSIDMLPGELHEQAFRRYCAENSLTFVGVPA